MVGRLIAIRARPVSSIENQTAWVSCTKPELGLTLDGLRERTYFVYLEPICPSSLKTKVNYSKTCGILEHIPVASWTKTTSLAVEPPKPLGWRLST